MICSICANDIEDDGFGYDEGHNAEPLVDGGRCCNDCNRDIVIPSRLMGAPDFISILKKERLHPDFANGFIRMFKRRKVKLHEREIPTPHEVLKRQAEVEYSGLKEKWGGFLPNDK